jgi:hypothetical protein
MRRLVYEKPAEGFSVKSIPTQTLGFITVRVPFKRLPDVKGVLVRLEPKEGCLPAQMEEALTIVRSCGPKSIQAMAVRVLVATPEMEDTVDELVGNAELPDETSVRAVVVEMAKESAIAEELKDSLVNYVCEVYDRTEDSDVYR